LEWYKGITMLFSRDYSLINEHVLGVHLVSMCKRFGPLYAHNCFAFESFYGSMKKWKSGTSQQQTQMLHMNGYMNALQYFAHNQLITNETPLGELFQDLKIHVNITRDR
jgi:hypothetical protein